MKKFNKSKVIIPALAMIALTTAASATGTVAWFAANRATSITTGSFVAFDDNRGLKITAANVIGTSVDPDDYVVTPLGPLTDGSYDFTKVWTDVTNNDGSQPTSYKAAPANLEVENVLVGTEPNQKKVYYAVQWNYTIGLTNTNGTLAQNIDVMFDKTSSFANTSDKTAPGFRIAMQCGTEKFVFSNNSNDSDDTRKKHVSGENTSVNFTDDEYLTHDGEYTKLSDGVSHIAAPEYLGTITASGETLTVKCTAWYEGNDSNVVSNNITETMSGVSATLKFYARNAATPVDNGD